MATAIRAVLFDIGGVIADSPIMAIRRYCASIGMADINPFLGDSPAWNAYMRGAMARPEYDVALAAELEEARRRMRERKIGAHEAERPRFAFRNDSL